MLAIPTLFATPKSFSQFLEDGSKYAYSQKNDPSTSANPSVYRTLRVGEGMNRTHLTLADVAKTKDFPQTVRIYSEKYGGAKNFITNRFQNVTTNQQRFQVETASVDRNLWAISVMNTTPNVISFQMSSQTGTQTFTHQAAEYDVYALQFPEGVAKLDAEIMAINAHVTAHHAQVASIAILQAYTAFARQSTFSPSSASTVKEAFQNMARMHGIFTKSEFACTDVFARLDRVYASYGGFSELITSRESAIGMMQQTDLNINFMKNGASAEENQSRIDTPVRMMGKRISALPIVEPAYHNSTDYRYLNRECQTITIAPFVDYTHRRPWNQFKTSQRNIEYVSYTTDNWDRYDIIDAIESLPWFYNKEFDAPEKVGELDLELLEELASDASIEYHNHRAGIPMTNISMRRRPFELAGTIPDGIANETAFPFLRFIGPNEVSMLGEASKTAYPYGRFVVCKTIGELPRQNIKIEYLEQTIRQIHREYKNRIDKIGSGDNSELVLKSLFHKHPYSNFGETKDAFEALPDISKKNRKETKDVRMIPENDALTNSIFVERVNALKKLAGSDFDLLYIGMMYLTQPIDTVFFRKCAKNNINQILGVFNLRFEARLMRSVLAASQDNNGTFGVAFSTGIEVSQFDKEVEQSGETKQGSITIGGSYGCAITNKHTICPLLNVQGSHTLEGCGGNGNEYFPQRAVRKGKLAIRDVRRMISRGRSNFAVLTFTNAMIENTLPDVFSATGYVLPGDLQQFLDHSPEFGKNRRAPMYPGQHMFMYINYFFDRTTASQASMAINPEKLGFNDLVLLRNHSYLAGLGSIRHWTPTGELAITAEQHLDGPRLPGMRKRDQGLCMVGRGVNENKSIFLGTRGNMVGAGGVYGGAKRQKMERI